MLFKLYKKNIAIFSTANNVNISYNLAIYNQREVHIRKKTLKKFTKFIRAEDLSRAVDDFTTQKFSSKAWPCAPAVHTWVFRQPKARPTLPKAEELR